MLSITEQIVNSFPKSIIKPQNVFTIDNPDLLIPINRNLVGVFFIKKKEFKQLDLLLRRIYMSKLAYTSNMTPVVLVSDDDIITLDSSAHKNISHFPFFCEYKNVQDISTIFSDMDNVRMDYFNPNIQNKAIRRLWMIKSFIHERNGLIKQDKFGFVSIGNDANNIQIQPWVKNKPSMKNVCLLNDYDLLLERARKQDGFVSNFESILTYTMMYNYRLDNGYMLENRNNSHNKYLNTNWDFGTNESSLYFSTLALLGIMPIKVDNIDSIKEIGAAYDNYYWKFNKKRK